MTKMSGPELKAALGHFTGSPTFMRYGLGNLVVYLTEGARFVAEKAGAWWLMDAVLSYQLHNKVRDEVFQVFRLAVDLEKHSAKLTIVDGNNQLLATQDIEFTDFPLDEIELWCIYDGVVKTVLLPSEY